jgi:hypothetical protein
MEAMKTADGSFTPSMILAAVLLVGCVIITGFLKEPKFVTSEAK